MPVTIKPNLQLLYVTDIERSRAFYEKIFNAKPVFVSPRYIAFSASSNDEALFAIWTGAETPDQSAPRYSEVGILLPTNEDVDQLFATWKKEMEIKIIREPYNEVFGRTFVVSDPDGHLIRVSPTD